MCSPNDPKWEDPKKLPEYQPGYVPPSTSEPHFGGLKYVAKPEPEPDPQLAAILAKLVELTAVVKDIRTAVR